MVIGLGTGLGVEAEMLVREQVAEKPIIGCTSLCADPIIYFISCTQAKNSTWAFTSSTTLSYLMDSRFSRLGASLDGPISCYSNLTSRSFYRPS